MSDPNWDDIVEPEPAPKPAAFSRRNLMLGGGGLLAAGALAGGLGFAGGKRPLPVNTKGQRKINLAWNANAVCLAPALLAKTEGIYEANGLDVELVNFAGSTDQLLEAISTGKADAGVGMILRWMKPLEQGFDVKLIAGTHGGCLRLVGSRRHGVTDDVQSLRGKTIGVAEISGAGRNALAVLLKAHGLDPNKDVEWRAFPSPLLAAASEKGEIQAFVDSDPLLYLLQKQSNGDLIEVMSNLTSPWNNRFCCALGMNSGIVRDDRTTAAAMARSLVMAANICSRDPARIARAFAPFAKASEADLIAVLKMQTHDHHPVGTALRREVALYAGELRDAGIMKADLVPDQFAASVTDNVLA
ncbi:ABC transporter substrate-binding protein [soil metagenome]